MFFPKIMEELNNNFKNSDFCKLLRLCVCHLSVTDIKKTFCNGLFFCKNEACVNCGTSSATTLIWLLSSDHYRIPEWNYDGWLTSKQLSDYQIVPLSHSRVSLLLVATYCRVPSFWDEQQTFTRFWYFQAKICSPNPRTSDYRWTE